MQVWIQVDFLFKRIDIQMKIVIILIISSPYTFDNDLNA